MWVLHEAWSVEYGLILMSAQVSLTPGTGPGAAVHDGEGHPSNTDGHGRTGILSQPTPATLQRGVLGFLKVGAL